MASTAAYRERYGNHGPAYVCVEENEAPAKLIEINKEMKSGKFMNTLREIFLPYGFPESVSEDYVPYQVWDTLQAFCSTVSGILTTQAVMKGVGVGDNLASPLAATVTWILKDGMGMFGKITFAWWKGSHLDSDFKRWRLFADITNDLALTLEFLLFYFTDHATTILCISSFMKAIVGVAGGATRSAVTQHQAIRGNMADVSAKDGSQETCVNLVASMLSLLLLTCINTRSVIGVLFFWLIVIHIYANYRAVRSIVMKTLNAARYRELLHLYMSSGAVAGPKHINASEPVFFGRGKMDHDVCHYKILLGTTIRHVLRSRILSNEKLDELFLLYKTNKYIVIHDNIKKYIYVILHKQVSSDDVLQAYFHAVVLGVMAIKGSVPSNDRRFLQEKAVDKSMDVYSVISLLKTAMYVVGPEFYKFKRLAETNGWNMTNHNLVVDEWRAVW